MKPHVIAGQLLRAIGQDHGSCHATEAKRPCDPIHGVISVRCLRPIVPRGCNEAHRGLSRPVRVNNTDIQQRIPVPPFTRSLLPPKTFRQDPACQGDAVVEHDFHIIRTSKPTIT